jgi:CBS domain-containing protein
MGAQAATWAVADPLAEVRVAEAMLATPRVVQESDPVAKARQLLDERGAALMVVDARGRLIGIITRSDLRDRADREGSRDLTVGEVAVRNLVTARPDEPLRAAARRMSRLGLRQLPVVDREPPVLPLGLLRRSDVLTVYGRAHDLGRDGDPTPTPGEHARRPDGPTEGPT